MQLQNFLIVIPEWIDNALKENSLPLSTLSDLDALSKVFTLNDIALLGHINGVILGGNSKLSSTLRETFRVAVMPENWPIKANTYVDKRLFENIELSLKTLTFTYGNTPLQSIEACVKSYIISDTTKRWELDALFAEPLTDEEKAYGLFSFSLECISENVYGLRFKRETGYVSQDVRTYQSLKQSLELLYRSYDLKDLVESDLFKTYSQYIQKVK